MTFYESVTILGPTPLELVRDGAWFLIEAQPCSRWIVPLETFKMFDLDQSLFPGDVVILDHEADKALATGSAEELVKLVTDEAAAGIRGRFAEVQEKQAHAGHNVEAGREFVAAYVEYVHYIERLHQAARSVAHHAGAAAKPTEEKSASVHKH